MHLILSHAWTLDDADHLRRYVEITDEFADFHRAQPGFVSRRLIQDTEDPRHFINLRYWRDAADYAAMIAVPEYRTWIDRLSEHVEPRDPQKVIGEVALDSCTEPTSTDSTDVEST